MVEGLAVRAAGRHPDIGRNRGNCDHGADSHGSGARLAGLNGARLWARQAEANQLARLAAVHRVLEVKDGLRAGTRKNAFVRTTPQSPEIVTTNLRVESMLTGCLLPDDRSRHMAKYPGRLGGWSPMIGPSSPTLVFPDGNSRLAFEGAPQDPTRTACRQGKTPGDEDANSLTLRSRASDEASPSVCPGGG